jgi:Protein of unknown function (DUF2846)
MPHKSKLLFLVFFLALVSTLPGCLTAGLGPQFTEPVAPGAAKAVIYVYRSKGVMTAGTSPGVMMNDVSLVSSLYEVNYFPISVKPGTYTFAPKQFGIFKTTEVTVNAEASRVYYVRLDVNIGHLKFQQVNKDEAMSYLATCYQINPNVINDSRVLVDKNSASEPPAAQAPAASKTVPAVAVKTSVVPKQSQLYVQTDPADARIRILNIKPRFKQGIKLNGGRYHIEVSAPGYVKALQWITLKTDEDRQLTVDLLPEKVLATPAVTSPKAKTVAPKVKSKVAIIAPANATAEERRYAGMLQSTSSGNIRNAAKNLYHRYSDSSYLASVAEQSLLKNYNKEATDNIHVDAMAWLCKALARTGDPRFVSTLQAVAENASQRKLRSYAQKSLSQL